MRDVTQDLFAASMDSAANILFQLESDLLAIRRFLRLVDSGGTISKRKLQEPVAV